MENTVIYIVENGESNRGGHVVSAHRSYYKAVDAALKVECCFSEGWVQVSSNVWKNGCDYVTVRPISLED